VVLAGRPDPSICTAGHSRQHSLPKGLPQQLNRLFAGAVAGDDRIRLQGLQRRQSLIEASMTRVEQVKTTDEGVNPSFSAQTSHVLHGVHQPSMTAPQTDDETMVSPNP
jgi:hypothetical protein